MLVPYFFGWKRLALYPATFFLFVMQFFFFGQTHFVSASTNKKMHELVRSSRFYNETSFAYSNWIKDHPSSYSISEHRFVDKAKSGDLSYRRMLASLAVKDSEFRSNIKNVKGTQNIVDQKDWLDEWKKIEEIEKASLLQTYGYKSGQSSFFDMISYQFIHAGLLHFIMNLFFFLLLAPLVESILGSFAFLCWYLVGGIAAASFYFLLHAGSNVPLVGASGSISFLLGFACIYLWKQKIYYFYWLLPLKNYYGFIKLSPILALVMWLLSDMAAEFAAGPFQSVANSAHLGGMLLGILIGAIYLFVHKRWGIYKVFAWSESTT